MPDQPEELVAGGLASGKNELAAQVLRSAGRLRLAVAGSSMLPAIRPNDILLIRRCPMEAAGVGDIVLFTRDRRLFAHRVVARSPCTLVTQGDAVAQPDAPVGRSELLGRVVRIVRRGQALRLRPRRSLRNRLAAGLFRRSARAGRWFTRLDRLRGRMGL